MKKKKPNLEYCNICVLPNTRPNLKINGIKNCNCFVASQKKIDWLKRKKEFKEIIEKVKKRKSLYDCVIPVSGGKDSTWQTTIALNYGLKPLCVTWKTPARTNIGKLNLENLINLGVDHIDFSLNPLIEKKFVLKTFKEFGNPLIPMHLALHAIPTNIAIEKKIPLILWGENSAYEYGGEQKYKGAFMDNKWRKKFGVNEGKNIEYWVSKNLSKKDLMNYEIPSFSNIKKSNIFEVFLGHFFKWSPKKIYEIAKKKGFKSARKPKTGIYNFADIDDSFLITIHHYMKWYKFGFSREWDNLSIEIRENNMSRKDAINTLENAGFKEPIKEIDLFCKYLDITKSDFDKIIEIHRNRNIWYKKNNKWKIKDFLIENWNW